MMRLSITIEVATPDRNRREAAQTALLQTNKAQKLSRIAVELRKRTHPR